MAEITHPRKWKKIHTPKMGFKGEILTKRVNRIKKLVAALPSLEDPHVEYTLPRSCFAFPKFAFALRSTDTTEHGESRQDFDNTVRGGLGKILGIALTDPQWEQATLPVASGGFSL